MQCLACSQGSTVRAFHSHLPLKKCANRENERANKGLKLPSPPTLSAPVQRLQSSGRKAPITVVFCKDETSFTGEATGQRTVVKLVSVRIFGGYSLGSSRDITAQC